MKAIHYPNKIKLRTQNSQPYQWGIRLLSNQLQRMRFAMHYRYSIVIPRFIPCANTA